MISIRNNKICKVANWKELHRFFPLDHFILGLSFNISATIRKFDPVARQNLTDFGQYCAECMPKYVQKVQLTAGDELEILVAPEGVVPVLSFLKSHHNAQFGNVADICALDVPTREYRFEVRLQLGQLIMT